MYIVHSPAYASVDARARAYTHTHTHTHSQRKGATVLKSKRNLGSPFSAVPVNSYSQIEDTCILKRVFLTLRTQL